MISAFPFIIWSQAGRGVRVTILRCLLVTGPQARGCEEYPAALRQLTLPASCLFSNFQLPMAPIQWPPPVPHWGRCSEGCWNLRSKPPDPIQYFCSRAVLLWVTRASFKLSVLGPNCVIANRIRPAEVSLNFWILTSCFGSYSIHLWVMGTEQVSKLMILN